MDKFIIEKVMESCRISEVIGEFLELKKVGAALVCKCPFHNEKTPSFHVNKEYYKCFGCGKGGDAIQFLIEYKGFNFTQALEYIANKYHIVMEKEYTKPIPKNITNLSEKVINWFASRGIGEQTLVDFKITECEEWMPQTNKKENTINYNYFKNGELVNVKYRDGRKNFKLFKGGELVLYNLDAVKDCKEIIIVEGENDALAFHQAGYKNVVSVPNGAGASKNNLTYLDNSVDFLPDAEYILAVDNDAPGYKLRAELATRLGIEKCYKVDFKDCKDANEVLVKKGVQGIIDLVSSKKEFPIEGIYTAKDINDEIEDYYTNGLPKGAKIGLSSFDELLQFHRGYITTVTGIPGHGKALCINTDIPTTEGWKKMKDVKVGDYLFDEKGVPCEVTNITGIMSDRPCYKITFDDGETIIADENHQWVTDTWQSRRSKSNAIKNGRDKQRVLSKRGTDQTSKRTTESVKNTLDIYKTLKVKNDNRNNHSIPFCLPVQYGVKELLIDPYFLGVWLGDGNSDSAAITCNDIEIIDNIRSLGFEVTKHNSKYHYGVLKTAIKLRELGVIKNKHIPEMYLRGSVDQRKELLQGLMDTDGCITSYGRCEFTQVNSVLAYQVYELITSLGIQATIFEYDAKLNGRIVSKKHRIMFTPDFSVFKLSRKAKYCKDKIRFKHRMIVGCEKIASVPVKCIMVNSESHLFLVTKSFIPTHNSNFVDYITIRLNAIYGWKVGYYSPENYPMQLHFSNMAEKLVGKSFYNNHKMTRVEVEQAKNYFTDNFFFINPESDFTLDSILTKARSLVKRKGISVLVIDAWNKLDHQYTDSETKYISQQLDKLTMFCQMNNVHLFLVAHPTKIQKDKSTGAYEVPNLYNISGSANFFNKTANGICVYRNYKDGERNAEIYVQKVKFKHWGNVGMASMFWDRETGRYYLDKPDYDNWITHEVVEQIDMFTGDNDNAPF